MKKAKILSPLYTLSPEKWRKKYEKYKDTDRMTFLKLIDEDESIENVEELNEFFMTDVLTDEHFNDIDKLKEWILEVPQCIYFIEKSKYGDRSIIIRQYEWDE